MLTIRLSRVGKKNYPQYRVVVQDHKRSPKGKNIEALGYYHPLVKKFECDLAQVEIRIKQGAKPSSTVARLLKNAGMKGMDAYIKVVTPKTAKKEEAAA